MDQKISNKDQRALSHHSPKQLAIVTVLSHSSFRSLWFGQLCSQLSVTTLMFVLALRVYQETQSSAAVSGVYLTFGVPSFLFGMGAGAIVDHFDKRFVLVLCDIARGLLALGFLFASSNVLFMYIIAFFIASVTQFAVPSEASSIPRLVKDEQLVTANSIFSFTFYSSLAVGSLLAGPLLRMLGPWAIYVFIGVVFFLASYNVSRLPKENGKRQSIQGITVRLLLRYVQKLLESMSDGVRYIRKNPVLTDSLLLLTGTQVILGLLATLGPAFADKMLHIDVHDSSLVLIGPAVVGIVLGALWVGNAGFKLGAHKLIQWGVISAGLLLICVASIVHINTLTVVRGMTQNPALLPIILMLFFLLGIANSMLDVPANSILQREAEGPMRGRVYGMLTTAVGGLGIFPIVISSILADVIGVGKVVFILGIIITFYGVYRSKNRILAKT